MNCKCFIFLLLTCPLFLIQFQFSLAQNGVNSAYLSLENDFNASDINANLFTGLVMISATILNPYDVQADIASQLGPGNYGRFANLGNENPNLRIGLSIDGVNPDRSISALMLIGVGNVNESVFARMASLSSSRKIFIESSIKLARSLGIDGLDLDWAYPETSSEMTNYGRLLSEWRSAIASEARSTGKSPLLLTAAVNYAPRVNGLDYPIQTMVESVDWLNLKAYDFYDPTQPRDRTKANAPLYDLVGQASVSYGVEAWIKAGAEPKKLVLGLPYSGYASQLMNPNNHGLDAPANGPVGPANGAMSYVEIRRFIANNMASVVYNATIGTNYCYNATTWIGYDDVETIAAKVAYAKQKGLLGYFVSDVANDDNGTLSKQAKEAWEA